MKKDKLIVIVTILAVVTLAGTCIVLPFANEMYYNLYVIGDELNESGVNVTDYALYFEEDPVWEWECYLAINVTNENDFGLSRVWIDVNYTDVRRPSRERTETFVANELEPHESQWARGFMSIDHFFDMSKVDALPSGEGVLREEECTVLIDEQYVKMFYTDFHVTDIRAYKYK